jgi:hypothetical protein
MNNTQVLKEAAIKVNNLLSEYVETHNKILKRTATFRSIFSRINYKELYDETKTLLSKFISTNEEICEQKTELYNDLTDDEREFLNCLVEYINVLRNTVNILSTKTGLQLNRRENKISFKEYKNEYRIFEKKYNDHINDYMKIGERLNSLYKKLYTI